VGVSVDLVDGSHVDAVLVVAAVRFDGHEFDDDRVVVLEVRLSDQVGVEGVDVGFNCATLVKYVDGKFAEQDGSVPIGVALPDFELCDGVVGLGEEQTGEECQQLCDHDYKYRA
jgi:hypothetical protein